MLMLLHGLGLRWHLAGHQPLRQDVGRRYVGRFDLARVGWVAAVHRHDDWIHARAAGEQQTAHDDHFGPTFHLRVILALLGVHFFNSAPKGQHQIAARRGSIV